MERTIQAPEREFLDETESATWLGIPEHRFKALVKQGIIPDGTPFGERTRRWRWDVLYAIGVLMEHLISKTDPELSGAQGRAGHK